MIHSKSKPIIISYPKSGRNWLRTILACFGVNAEYSHDNADLPLKIHAHRWTSITKKTERKIILVTRDPKDTIVSSYYAMKECAVENDKFKGTLSEFIRNDSMGANKIKKFNDTWNEKKNAYNKLIKISYEDLQLNFESTVKKLLNFLDISVTDEQIRDVKYKTSIKVQQKQAKTKIKKLKFRKGIIGDYKNIMSKEDINYCDNIFNQEIVKTDKTRLAVLVYSIPHRRSQEILIRLAAKKINATIIILDWIERENFKPIYEHRPTPIFNMNTKLLARNLNFVTIETTHNKLNSTLKDLHPTYILLGGARLIEKHTTEEFTIINSHPSYLPYCRGLDALKWAIFNGEPIGVTTHVINEDIDSGKLIRQEFLETKINEDFSAFAARQFDLECKMLVDAIDDIKQSKLEQIKLENHTPNRRMPHELEPQMLTRFEHRKLKNAR